MVAKLLPGRVMWQSIATLMQTWVSGRFFGGGTFLYACGRVNNPIVDAAEAIGTLFSSRLGAMMLRLFPGKTACGQT
jgi:hypothetical protein